MYIYIAKYASAASMKCLNAHKEKGQKKERFERTQEGNISCIVVISSGVQVFFLFFPEYLSCFLSLPRKCIIKALLIIDY